MRQHRFILSYRTSNQWEHLRNEGFRTRRQALYAAYDLIVNCKVKIGDLSLDGVSLNLPSIQKELKELA